MIVGNLFSGIQTIKGTTTEVDFFISQNTFVGVSFTYTVPAGYHLDVSRYIDTGGQLLLSGQNRTNWSNLGNWKVPSGVTISATIGAGGSGFQAGIYGMLFTNT